MAKREAVAEEDYDKAEEIKDEVDSLRAEIEGKVWSLAPITLLRLITVQSRMLLSNFIWFLIFIYFMLPHGRVYHNILV